MFTFVVPKYIRDAIEFVVGRSNASEGPGDASHS